ncbi:alpha-beta hydrolase superfamily lysophospholipase [Stella humosa]|uniref:Alpha-beta hydrolase superfamily lysophospholipase n=1 Tax=Stella humosa TaxID=94 RepID=A0A3N1L5B2_9PROT|nr:alpha/beta hydrolase [Stella humosa]ROP84585.1 alpha-beta hydrolase superfamily lysophospholipase [Stella humosa]BBK34105.1 alpha/beta hydrolase [Stella humosa]
MARALRILLLLAVAVLPACAPGYVLPGPSLNEPELEKSELVTADGLRLPMRVWSPGEEPRAIIVALHGFNDHSTAFEMPAVEWARHGIATYAYDQRGFGSAPNTGRWPGMAALARDAGTAIRLVRARHPGLPVYLLGESMGGAIAMVALTGADAPPVDGAILVAPAVWGRQTMGLGKRLALATISSTMPWLTLSGRGLGYRPSDNEDMLRAFSRDPLVIKETRADTVKGLVDLMDAALAASARFRTPALILYGEKDQIVPREPTALMLSRLAGAADRQRVAVYPEGWHMLLRDLQAQVVWADIRAWIEDPAAPLPSGADRDARLRLEREAAS